MKTSVSRWLLAPLTSWRALLLAQKSHEQLDFDTAWRRIRAQEHPDEIAYQRQGHRSTTSTHHDH